MSYILDIFPQYDPQKPIICISSNMANNPKHASIIQDQTAYFSFGADNRVTRLIINIVTIAYT